MAAATTPGSFDSDTPSFPDDPAAMSQSSLTSATSDEDNESIMSTPKRYPAHLSHGSAPRQRQQQQTQRVRPNSSQYETMEELLTAAGYTVTRVFTPETERVQRLSQGRDEEDEDGQKTGEQGTRAASGIGRLVTGLIAHIMPSTSGGSTTSRRPTPALRVQIVDDADSNPFLDSSSPMMRSAGSAYSQAAHSLRTHLLSAHTAARASSNTRSKSTHRAQPALRHTTSAPSLPRTTSGRRRALPSAWRDAANNPNKPAWSGGFVPKTIDTQLKPRSGWFGTVRPADARAQTSPAATIRARTSTLRPPIPTLHRARSAPRSTRVHVPLPAPPARPSPVVQANTVVCRSQTNLVVPARSRSLSRGRKTDESPILAPEPGSTSTEGLPPTPARPTLQRARSNGFLKRPVVHMHTPSFADDEPDLASIISAFRSSSPSRRQRSIRSLRALLKDPRFPDVPVVCVASPGTAGAGLPGRALWMTGPEWEAEVGRKNTFNGRG
ncbi:hypothetical protein RhiLY_09932 [Ceratobasidium sp. AG-Ba]|nr:hypothetical protein RhiLY_09932 [Ceratobasidium sp. AG-Ba]